MNGDDIVKIVHGDDFFVILLKSKNVVTISNNNPGCDHLVQPSHVDNLDIIDVAAGGQHIVVLTDQNELYSWGKNVSPPIDGVVYTGQCVNMKSDKKIDSITAGTYYTACSFDDGTISVWGDNGAQQCDCDHIHDARSVHSGGEGNIFYIDKKNTLTSWGLKESNHKIHDIQQFYGGHYHHIARKTNGDLVPLGRAMTSELNIPDINKHDIKIACVGGELPGHSFILQKCGMLYGFGSNMYGQLHPSLPYKNDVQAIIPGRWKYISTGLSWTVGVTHAGELTGWGVFGVDY